MMEYKLRGAMMEYPMMPDGEPEKHGQHLCFTVEQLPELVMWEPGEEYLLVVKVKQTSYMVDKSEGSIEEKADFEVVEVGAIKDMSVNDNSADTVKSKLNMK